MKITTGMPFLNKKKWEITTGMLFQEIPKYRYIDYSWTVSKSSVKLGKALSAPFPSYFDKAVLQILWYIT